MNSKQITPPIAAPITLGKAKAHLRIDSDAEDEAIGDLIEAATQMIERETGLALITQTWRVWLDDLPRDGVVCLPRNPVQRITSVTWFDDAGTPHELPGSAYFLNSITKPARLRFDRSQLPPGLCNGVEIDFEAGFGEAGVDVPDLLNRAILTLLSHWYEFRGVYAASEQPVSVPQVYDRLIRHYREHRI